MPVTLGIAVLQSLVPALMVLMAVLSGSQHGSGDIGFSSAPPVYTMRTDQGLGVAVFVLYVGAFLFP